MSRLGTALRLIFRLAMLIGKVVLFLAALRNDWLAGRTTGKIDAAPPARGIRARLLAGAAEAARRRFDAGDDLGPEIRRAPKGHCLDFEYADRHGEVSVRSITNWVEHREHVRGWCSKRRAVRTFRKDRVLDWIGGGTALRRR